MDHYFQKKTIRLLIINLQEIYQIGFRHFYQKGRFQMLQRNALLII